MTREEAHIILSNGLANAPSEHEWCVAFEMAIKALDQEPCEDAISRQAVLDLCERFDGCVPYSVLSNHDILPSVSAEKTGRWTPYCYQNCECSICGYIISESDSEEFNFCPNCGAKMEVEK